MKEGICGWERHSISHTCKWSVDYG